MKKLILVLILITSGMYSFEKKDGFYAYAAVGADLIAPSFAIGIRKWDEDDGFDMNLGLTSLIFVNRLAVNAAYLKKFNDNKYIGIGGGAFIANMALNGDNLVNCGVFPALKFGKENPSTFHELSLSVPTISQYGIMFYPMVSYKYGF
jgi:hypothetical protein